MSDLCSWVTGLFTPRRAKAAFGVTLPIEAELAETQISNVHLVQCGGGEPCALKVICFEKVRRAIVEREAAAQKLAHDHESVLTLLKDEMVPTGARSTPCVHAVRTPHTHTTRTLHAHCMHTTCTLHAHCMHTACTSVSARTANADVLELRLLFPFYGGGTLAEALELHPAGLAEAVALAV